MKANMAFQNINKFVFFSFKVFPVIAIYSHESVPLRSQTTPPAKQRATTRHRRDGTTNPGPPRYQNYSASLASSPFVSKATDITVTLTKNKGYVGSSSTYQRQDNAMDCIPHVLLRLHEVGRDLLRQCPAARSCIRFIRQ